MQAVVGGNVVYPNLTEIADLFRSQINDTANNTGGSGTGSGITAGLIMPNTNPDLVTFMRAAIRDLYSDLRNVGDPQLILDNYQLIGLPPVNSNLGPGAPNPGTQVSIAFSGYFDGVQWYPQWTLPVSLKRILAMYERTTGTNDDYTPMTPAPNGLPSIQQGQRQQYWEVRQGAVWMPGALQLTDIRIRCRIGFPSNYNVANLNYDTTYVPIMNCANAVVAKMCVRYARRFAPVALAGALADETDQMDKLKLETVRAMQTTENQRQPFGDDAVQDFAVAWSWL